MATQISVGFKKRFSVGGFKDAAGNDTTIDPTTPVTRMATADPAIAEIVDQDPATPLSAAVKINAQGTTQVQVDVDVDRGGSVKTLTLLADVEGIAGEAVTGTLNFEGDEVPA